jgi:putative transposase
MAAVGQLAPEVRITAAYEALGVSRASFYRQRSCHVREPKPRPPRSLSASEQQQVLDILHSERFVD